jgi:hypothetical protein
MLGMKDLVAGKKRNWWTFAWNMVVVGVCTLFFFKYI